MRIVSDGKWSYFMEEYEKKGQIKIIDYTMFYC